eukprot:CAMPEP_0183754002 /NCGR_PEP_ID=MMETSP0739-20130205/3297_1 /TAXON_ID=385413 /ORGANISM="Thalassiosira miniscula, Strain CCMP1093" /LENGTH=37 /DNA_ID= /DNA_START= /DNA_END= /DNA_ORIENTATION=
MTLASIPVSLEAAAAVPMMNLGLYLRGRVQPRKSHGR